jgi:spermidine synthase
MYHVIGTGITALLLYFLSYFFYRNNFYSRQFHRKLWNILLATAFILTVLAGIFIALQINYKWNVPFIKTILKWHVEFGVGLAITGSFHLFWHFSYFFSASRDKGIILSAGKALKSRIDLSLNLFVIGFISSSVQLLLLKEIMNISGGYELIAGTFLGSWLIGSAAGSWRASKSTISDIRKINLIFSVSPLISILLIIILARVYLKPGETPSYLAGIIYTLIVLIPFCFVSGFSFIKLLDIGAASGKFLPGKSYSIETLGGITAGIIVAIIGSGRLNTYKALLLVTLLGISYTVLTWYLEHKRAKLVFRLTVFTVAVLIIILSPDLWLRQMLMRGVRVIKSIDTQYGNITIAEYGGDATTYYDQRLLNYNDDATEREEDIHYAMLQTERPESVLLISGSVNSHLKEISKYNVEKVVYVERDPELIKTEKPENFPEIKELIIKNDDAFTFVKNSNDKFDATIVMTPPPSSLLLNRYYTLEFFTNIKRIMKPGGTFACSPGVNPNYFNRESVDFYSSIFNTLKSVFKNVIPVGGSKIYFIASDKDLSTSFCELAESRNIQNFYVGPDYLSDDLIKAKSDEILSLMNRDTGINRSAFPIACFYYQAYNLSKSINERIPAIILLIILFLLPVITIRRNRLIMYFSASALAAFEILLLILLQLTAGNMYQLTGLIIAGILGGLAAGTGIGLRLRGRSHIAIKVFLLIIFYLLAGLATDHVLSLGGHWTVILLLIISGFVPAFVTGTIFNEMTLRNNDISATASVYNADLAGSAIGFILFSGLFVPLLGIKSSLFILPAMIFAGFLFDSVKK